MDITLRVADNEADIYRSFIKSDMPCCPHCNAPIELRAEDMHLVVYSPLTPMFGMEIGRPKFQCNKCGQTVEIIADMDLHAFPSIIQYLTRLRQEYKARLARAATKPKGIVYNGQK